MQFLSKYLGFRRLIRRPNETPQAAIHDVVHELVVAAAELESGDDVPLVQVVVTDAAFEMRQHPKSRHRGPPLRAQVFPLDFVSHAGQDGVYERVVSLVFVAEVNARYTSCECHAFCLPTVAATRRFAYAIRLAFQAVMRRVQMGAPMQMGVTLQSCTPARAQVAGEGGQTSGAAEDATEA